MTKKNLPVPAPGSVPGCEPGSVPGWTRVSVLSFSATKPLGSVPAMVPAVPPSSNGIILQPELLFGIYLTKALVFFCVRKRCDSGNFWIAAEPTLAGFSVCESTKTESALTIKNLQLRNHHTSWIWVFGSGAGDRRRLPCEDFQPGSTRVRTRVHPGPPCSGE